MEFHIQHERQERFIILLGVQLLRANHEATNRVSLDCFKQTPNLVHWSGFQFSR